MPARPRREILDVRIHLPVSREAASPYAAWNLSESAFVRALDRSGIRHAVLHPPPSPPEADFASCVRRNRELLRFVERFPKRFTAACGIDLRFPEESLREIEAWKKHGMVWIADVIHPIKGNEPAVPAFDRVIEHATSLNLIATVAAGSDAAAAIARTHPSARLVFAHLEFGLDPYVARLSAIARGAGFHADTSPRGYERMGLIEMAADRLGAGRLLFASRFSVHSASAVIARIENAFLEETQKEAILAGNARALLAKAGWKF